jgi:hypothetical protein
LPIFVQLPLTRGCCQNFLTSGIYPKCFPLLFSLFSLLSLSPSVRPSIHPSFHLSICMIVCMSVRLSHFFFLFFFEVGVTSLLIDVSHSLYTALIGTIIVAFTWWLVFKLV